MNHPQPWEIEAWVDDGSPISDDALALAKHVEACAQCAREVAWLRTERRLFAARAARLPLRLPAFEQIEERIGAVEATLSAEGEADNAVPRQETRWGDWARSAGAGAVAAAALALVWGPLGSAGVSRGEQGEDTSMASEAQSTWLGSEWETGASLSATEPLASSAPAEPACNGDEERSAAQPSCEDTAQLWMSCEMP